MTSTQAARFLGVSLHTVRNWTRDGRLPHYRTAGSHRRFLRADLAPLRVTREGGAASVGAADQVAAWTETIDAALADAITAVGPERGAVFVRLREVLRTSQAGRRSETAPQRAEDDAHLGGHAGDDEFNPYSESNPSVRRLPDGR